MVREAYKQIAGCFVETVVQVREAEWGHTGLGEWTVRDLVGHTSRALLTVETYLDKPASSIEVKRPVDYFLRAKTSLGDPPAVAARGREAGKALGSDPWQTVRKTAARVLARVEQTADGVLVATPVGGMRLIDYLPSRIFELTIHTLDLAAATQQQVTVPSSAARITFALLAELACESGRTEPLMFAATGRRALPEGYSVLRVDRTRRDHGEVHTTCDSDA